MQSYPFTSRVTYDSQSLPVYDRAVDSAFLRTFYAAYWSDGVFYKPSTSFMVTADGTGLAVQVAPGIAQIQGAFAIETDAQTLAIDAASNTLGRIDSIVLRLDLSMDKRCIELAVLKGAAAAEPLAPTLTRNTTTWELGIANVIVRAGAAAISQQDVVDTRLDTERCGVVSQTVGDMDTSGFFKQLSAQLDVLRQEISDVESGTAAMMRATYDPQGRRTDIFKAIDKVSNIYYARLTLGGWTACSSADQANGLLYQQTATLTCANSHAPVVTAASVFLSGIGYDKTGVPATDDVLNEVQDIINNGVTVTAYNSVLVKVKEKPTAEIRARWVIQS